MPIKQLESSDRFCQDLFRSGRAFKSLQSSSIKMTMWCPFISSPWMVYPIWHSTVNGDLGKAFCSTVSRIVCTLFASHVTRAICLLWMEKLIQFETYFFLSMRFLLILYKLCCCWNCFHTVLISWVYLL